MRAESWYRTFIQILDRHDTADPLREAAIAGRLADWTAALTRTVVTACEQSGLRPVAKGFPAAFMPEPREEYLGLDVVAFDAAGSRWPAPVAVFELENSPSDERVAYSLWKVLCVRSRARFVFAYRNSAREAALLLEALVRDVAPEFTADGDTVVVIGLKDEVATFPHGYFRPWRLDPGTGRFERLV